VRIGELAQRSGTSVQTLRYYEREGILRRAARTASGYRAYSETDAEHVVFVRNCQAIGFSLADIRELSAMHGLGPEAGSRASPAKTGPRPGAARNQFLALARARLGQLQNKIAELQKLEHQIATLVRRAEDPKANACPAMPQKTP